MAPQLAPKAPQTQVQDFHQVQILQSPVQDFHQVQIPQSQVRGFHQVQILQSQIQDFLQVPNHLSIIPRFHWSYYSNFLHFFHQ